MRLDRGLKASGIGCKRIIVVKLIKIANQVTVRSERTYLNMKKLMLGKVE